MAMAVSEHMLKCFEMGYDASSVSRLSQNVLSYHVESGFVVQSCLYLIPWLGVGQGSALKIGCILIHHFRFQCHSSSRDMECNVVWWHSLWLAVLDIREGPCPYIQARSFHKAHCLDH